MPAQARPAPPPPAQTQSLPWHAATALTPPGARSPRSAPDPRAAVPPAGAVGLACGFGYVDTGFQAAYVGLGTSFYNKGTGCGRCVRISCDDTLCASPGAQAVAQVVDLCGALLLLPGGAWAGVPASQPASPTAAAAGDCYDADIAVALPLWKNLTGREPNTNPSFQLSWEFVDCAPYINGSSLGGRGLAGGAAWAAHVAACQPDRLAPPPPWPCRHHQDACEAWRECLLQRLQFRKRCTGLGGCIGGGATRAGSAAPAPHPAARPAAPPPAPQPISAVQVNGQLLKHSTSNYWEWNAGQAINPRGPFDFALLGANRQVLRVRVTQLRSQDLRIQVRLWCSFAAAAAAWWGCRQGRKRRAASPRSPPPPAAPCTPCLQFGQQPAASPAPAAPRASPAPASQNSSQPAGR